MEPNTPQLNAKAIVAEYVRLHSENGISQHTPEWLRAKTRTFGGSEKSVLDGSNPYSDMYKTLCIKTGVSVFGGDIKTQWGNVFEYLLRTYTENVMDTEVQGHNLFIKGPEPFSYSPDGIGVVEAVVENKEVVKVSLNSAPPSQATTPTVMLFEFKCPFSRIPNGKVPKYYVPQCKQGLDIITICEAAVFIEGVFRRCAWEQLEDNTEYDNTLVKNPPSGKHRPLAYGVIGFYSGIDSPYKDKYEEHFMYGDESNDYLINDLGDCSVELMTQLFDAYGRGEVEVWYGDIVRCDRKPHNTDTHMDQQVFVFNDYCRNNKYISYGFLPWKLLTYTTNVINKEPNYLAPSQEKARSLIALVEKCETLATPEEKKRVIASHLYEPVGFEDYYD